jgi:hypothetical protein
MKMVQRFQARNFSRQLMILIAATAITLTANIARAGATAPAILSLTEVSSSMLTATYNGPSGNSAFTVLNTSPDHWSITFISDIRFNAENFPLDWEEPEDPTNSANEITFNDNINTLFVVSDLVADAMPNNTVSPVVGFEDSQNGFANIAIQFNDLGDAQAPTGVPDTGSTLGMLTLASISLLGLSRFRSLRLA